MKKAIFSHHSVSLPSHKLFFSLLASPADLSKIHGVPTEPIITTGEVLLIYSDRAYQVSLPNGKKVIAHPAKALEARSGEIVPGAKVTLEMTPFDFEKARIAEIFPAS
ncbi:hypothetical protein N9294_01840 [bacterium]|nr:hypothetical protein [bacterium]